MAFDQTTRNRLQKFVSESRSLLSDEFTRQLQHDYGMDPDSGTVGNIDSLTHLNDARYQTAKLLRETMDHYLAASSCSDKKEILSRIVREQAFTVLNRLSALRMAEARGILMESISKGYNSKGFQLYARVAGTSLGETGDTYRNYLFSVFDEFAMDLAVLFDRYSPMGRLFPKESVLLELLEKINDVELENLWAEDETIGWIYQYFNSKEERKKMRDESQAPRNSRELAVRNQFFTPRYVVEFLTDNTLGRTWYEMTKGNTGLKDQCRYLVRRPNEIFLAKGENAPEENKTDADLSQEELLNLPVYIDHRPIKDPREILMLDPACGSMHFGLYAFDLFEKIYEESWDLQAAGQWQGAVSGKFGLLIETYPVKEDLLRDIPRLIIENNIHGVDIDPRAVQIAGLSLWLRAQRTWKEQGVKPVNRPQIRKSNIVCAEPMPGEKTFLQEFAQSLKPKVLGQLVEIIFEKMELAGEAGSLLKIEEEIADAVEQAREAFNKELLRRKEEAGYLPGFAPIQHQRELFDFADLPDKTQFWQTAEEKILDALRKYAEQAETEDGSQRRLFVEDAAKGFAFIDLCRKRYDVVLMNPPFGDSPSEANIYLKNRYNLGRPDAYMCFFYRSGNFLVEKGRVGAITSRTFQNLEFFIPLREKITTGDLPLQIMADLSGGVLDGATVETCASILQSTRNNFCQYAFFINATESQDREKLIRNSISDYNTSRHNEAFRIRNLKWFKSLPGTVIAYQVHDVALKSFIKHSVLDNNAAWGSIQSVENSNANVLQGLIPGDLFRFTRLRYEVDAVDLHRKKKWVPICRGGEYKKFFSSEVAVFNWREEGKEPKSFAEEHYGGASRTIKNTKYFFKGGFTYPRISSVGFNIRIMPSDHIFSDAGMAIISNHGSRFSLLGFLNSRLADYFVHTIHPGRKFEIAHVASMPTPDSILYSDELEKIAKQCFSLVKKIDSIDETNPFFISSIVSAYVNDKGSKQQLKNIIELLSIYQKSLSEINDIVFNLFGFDDKQKNELNEKYYNSGHSKEIPTGKDILYKTRRAIEVWPEVLNIENVNFRSEIKTLKESTVSYLVGAIYGRWDINYAIGKKDLPTLSDPFDPLPTSPPGMLQNTSGLPAEPKDVPSDYPLRISWSGIIVDDEGHSEDIITRVREAIEVIWKENANNIEQEACEILGVRDLREYFTKPGKFFADHLKRYSKSRRQAPIYWPLSTPSGSYTLWLYYHRLTDQTLYTCVNNFVCPKLKQVSDDAENLRKKSNRIQQEEKDLEKLSDMAVELKDFHDELLRIAEFWKPNLNDGVQITAAPLWKLFQLKAWQNKLKQTWKDLEKGKYDWAHLAYSIWPERVIRASHKDRSYAIAHDLEDDLWEEIETGTDKKGNPKTKWVPKKLSETELKQLIRHTYDNRNA